MADPLAKERPRCGVIIDGGRLARWQFDALIRIRSQFDITVYNCTNMRAATRRIRHWPYYALNPGGASNPADAKAAGKRARLGNHRFRL